MTFDPAGSFNRHFDAAIAEQVSKSGIPVSDWFWSGRRPPVKDVDHWREFGPVLVQRYIDWFESQPDIDVWVTPDGQPAIELDLTAKFGEIPVRVIIDQVLQAGTALIAVDVKSGSKTPDNLFQLGIAASALELTYGIRPKYGAFFMNRQEDRPLSQLTELTGYQFSVGFLANEFRKLDEADRAGIFVAKPSKDCARCGVASHCPAMGVRPTS